MSFLSLADITNTLIHNLSLRQYHLPFDTLCALIHIWSLLTYQFQTKLQVQVIPIFIVEHYMTWELSGKTCIDQQRTARQEEPGISSVFHIGCAPFSCMTYIIAYTLFILILILSLYVLVFVCLHGCT